MLHWLVDHANAVFLLLGLLAFVFLVLYWRNRQTPVLIAAGVFLALLGVVWVLTVFIVTDRRQITLAVREMAAAVGENRPERVVAHLAGDFRFQDVTKQNAAEAIRRTTKAYQISNVVVWQIEVEELDRDAGRARVSFRTRVDAARDSMFLCRGDWAREDGKWRMRNFQVFNPLVNTDQPIPIPLR